MGYKNETDVLRQLQLATEDRQKMYPGCEEWMLSQWGNALAGETGELCNFIKKIERDGSTPELREGLRKEIGDVVSYLAIICNKCGLDMGQEVIKKFNEVSDRKGCEIKIG